jgi:hypothetical protein
MQGRLFVIGHLSGLSPGVAASIRVPFPEMTVRLKV